MRNFLVFSNVFFLSTNLFAFDFLGYFKSKKPLREDTAKNTAHCVDFSGSWRGECLIQDHVLMADLSISQRGCEYISINMEKLNIEGSNSSSFHSKAEEGSTLTSSRWSEEDTNILEIYSQMFSKRQDGLPIVKNSFTRLSKVGETLRIKGSSKEYNEPAAEFECHLNR